LEAGLRDRPPPESDAPSDEELLDLLAGKARMVKCGGAGAFGACGAERPPCAGPGAVSGDGGEAAVSALLFKAFQALGPGGRTFEETALVADALLKSGDEEIRKLLDCRKGNEAWDRCREMAEEAGASAFVALDLALAIQNPEGYAKVGIRGVYPFGATRTGGVKILSRHALRTYPVATVLEREPGTLRPLWSALQRTECSGSADPSRLKTDQRWCAPRGKLRPRDRKGIRIPRRAEISG
jgi:hypothetical protein